MNNQTKDWLKNVIGRWIVVALAIVALALFSQSLKGQTITKAPLKDSIGAVTTCDQDNNIVIIFNQKIPSGAYPLILIHEMSHAEDMKAYPGGCRAVEDRIQTDEEFLVQGEAKAHCAVYNFVVAEGRFPKEIILKVAEFMQREYLPEKTVAEVLKILPCGKDVTIPP